MIFAAILAGGIGSRMGCTDTPKQFLTLGNKPVIIHTIEKFVINEKIDKIIVLIPKNFINHTNHLIEEYIPHNDDIIVIDCGLAFPDEEMYGVDLIIPDISYLINNKELKPKIKITSKQIKYKASVILNFLSNIVRIK